MRAESVAPRGIAGGFVLVPVRLLISTWRACRRSPLGVGDFRSWLACHEMLARRCTHDDGRSPTYTYIELSRLAGVSERRARASVNRLVEAGHLTWADAVVEFPDTESGSDPAGDCLADTIGGGEGSLAIPRRVLRLLAAGARPALIATALGILLRCLSRGRGGFKSRGRVKSTWIAHAFGLDVRRVKQARKELIALGWLVAEEPDQWAMNRWGRAYTIDLGWDRDGSEAGRRLPPPPPAGGRRLPPPDPDPEPLRENENQEPAPRGSAGVEIGEGGGKTIPPPSPVLAILAPVAPPPPTVRKQESGSRGSAPVVDGAGTSSAGVGPRRRAPRRPPAVADLAGGGPLPAPRLDDVRVEDLEETGRLLGLHDQAVTRGLVGPSEADRLGFIGAAEHAMAVGQANPPGLFMYLVRNRLWRHLTQEDEGRAHARIKRELRGERPPGSGVVTAGAWGVPSASADALVVGEVRAALIRAGIFRDPFPAFQRLNGDWTRERWERALSELGSSRGRT